MSIDKRRYMCDRSGFMYEKLHKQYEWAGDSLVWLGLWVGEDQLDKPNEQFRNKVPKTDPTPVPNPRPFRYK